ncbi:retrotransposon protein, putative, ty1-copia subclass [Tanacetum coccineum]
MRTIQKVHCGFIDVVNDSKTQGVIQTFLACKQEEGKPVVEYVLKMKGYVDQLERLGYVLPQDLSVGYNLDGRDLKGLPKKAETPQVMAIRSGKIQKANKKSLKAKGLRGARKLEQRALYLYVGNGVHAQVEAIESFDLVLPNDLVICLDNYHYAPTITRGVVSVHRLVENGFVQHFTDYGISVFKNDVLYFNVIPKVVDTKGNNGLLFLLPTWKYNMLLPSIAEFFKKSLITQEVSGRVVDLEEIQDEDTSPSEITSEIPMEVEGFEPPQEEVIPICRSERTHQAPNRLCQAEEHSLGDLNEPTSYKVAMLDPKSDKWLDAMNAKMQSMIDNNVWVLVDLPPNCKTIRSNWIFKKNTDMDGIVHTYKARLVAKDYTQLYGVDYEEMFSSVADIRAIRILISIAAFYDYEIWQMDVKTAFLNGYLDEDIYMVQPEGFVDPKHPKKVCKLQRSIYGLYIASRCVYQKDSGSNITFLILYVDDIIIMGNHIPSLQSVKDYLGKCFAMKDLGEAAFILGIKIYRDRSKRLIGLSQSAYMDKILKRYRMDNSKRGHIPMQERLDLNKTQGASTPEEVKRMQSVPHASAVGSIMYAVRCTRPDVAFAQNITSRFQQNPGEPHWTAVKNILKRRGWTGKAPASTTQVFATEAEYIIASEAAMEAVWIRKFISGLGIVPTINEPINMFCDNSAALLIANELGFRKASDTIIEDTIMIALPKGKLTQHARSIGLCWRSKPSNIWDSFGVLSIMLGEREEDLFLVMFLDGKVVRYDFVSRNVSTLTNFHSSRPPVSFEFITSFARVHVFLTSSLIPYTFVYTDSKPGRAFWGADDEEVSEGGIPWVIDEHELPAEEQPLPHVDSPTAESPGYVTESDPKEDPEEYEDDETEDGPVDYPMDGGDDGDDDDGDSSRDDADDEDEDEDEEEEEEHLAPADSAVVVPTDEPVSPPEGTEPVIPPPSTDITIGARITVRPQASISLPPEAEVERLLAMTTPSPSPPISLSPPSAGERLARCMAPPAHSSPPPVPSPLLPSSGCPTQIQTLRIASTQALIDAVTAALPSPPLPPLPPSLYIPPPVDRRDDIPESEQPPRKRLYLSTLGSRYEVGESSTARPTRGRGIDYGFVSTVDAEERRQGIRDVGYGIRDTWVDPAEAVPEIAPMTVGEVNTRVTWLAELHEHDTRDLYALLEDAQDSRSRISQRVDMDSQRVDLLMGDRMTLQEKVWMVEEEAYASREAWVHSIGLSQATHQELQTYRDHVYAHETHLQAHQTQLQLQGTLIQTQHQPGPEARIPDHQDASGDADSHIKNEKGYKYISGLPYNIYGNVKSVRPKTLDETIELATDLMD